MVFPLLEGKETEEVIAERRKLQQMLYETDENLKSPVKDVLLPKIEETVRERGGKLKISINTIELNGS